MSRPETMTAVDVVKWGLAKFKRYADHEMRCYAWGPGSSAFRHCSCGVREVVEIAEAWLKAQQGGQS
jgi:NTP pyrophosphatase (non-canonical NTP hydrolase)